jgi:hypothetical protein
VFLVVPAERGDWVAFADAQPGQRAGQPPGVPLDLPVTGVPGAVALPGDAFAAAEDQRAVLVSGKSSCMVLVIRAAGMANLRGFGATFER